MANDRKSGDSRGPTSGGMAASEQSRPPQEQPSSPRGDNNGAQPPPGSPTQGEPSGTANGHLNPGERFDPLEAVYQQLKRFPDEYGRSDDPAKSRWPEAHALMARVHFANGKSREPGRLTVQLGPTGVEWQLVDVTMGYKLVGACDHLCQLWESVQAAATSGSAKWMPLRYGEGYQLRKQMERKAIDDAANRR